MRLTFFAIVGCLACDPGAAKVVAAPPPAATHTPKALSAPALPSTPMAAASGNLPAAGPLTTASSDASSGELHSDGEPGCRFQRPKFWEAGGVVTWLGRCEKGFAQGLGVIVNVIEGMEPQHFYGRLARGFLSIGVLHTTGGFMAGRWENGVLAAELPNEVAARTIEAFDVGAAAATASSKSLAKKDVQASRFYAEEARKLREQMD